MRQPVRSLVYIYWIYDFSSSMVGVFVQLLLYQKFSNVPLNIVATIIFYTGIMVGFCVPGYIASLVKANLKHGFLLSFILLGGSLFYLLQVKDIKTAFMAMFFWGVGQGVFWLTVNTFELAETKDHERDFYSSMLNAGGQILTLLGPALATLLIWLGGIAHTGTYTLLFTVAPFIYLLGFLCFWGLADYRPPRITLADLKHFFVDKRNNVAQLYILGTGFQQILSTALIPLAAFFVLGTALNVGVFDTAAAIFSALCVFVLAQYRTPKDRILFYGLSVAGIAAATVWFGFALTFAALILYTVVLGILSPIQSVSHHVIDLQVMETGRKETDFYATMLLRDFFLWIWRCAGGCVFLLLVPYISSSQGLLEAGLYLIAAALLFSFLGAALFVRSAPQNT